MAGLLPLRAFSTNFSPEPADKLDTVRVPVVGAPSQSSDFTGNYTQNADSTVTVIPVQLNKHKFKTVHVTAREASETALNVLETLVSSAVKQLAQDVLQDVFSEITQANYGDPAIAALTDPETGITFGYLRYTETTSNRIFVTVECLYGYKLAIAGGIKRIVKP